MTEIELPYPPSINNYYATFRGRRILSKAGRIYKKTIKDLCLINKIKKCSGDIKVKIFAIPPDKRRRDLDNICKALLDALQSAGVYDDDSQIRVLFLRRGFAEPPGKVVVSVYEMGDAL